MEYGDEKLHLNQFLGQDWIESMAMQQEPIGLEVPIPYIFGLFWGLCKGISPQNMALYGRVPPIWDPGIPIELRLSWIVSLFARYSCQGLSLHIFCFLICHSVWIQRRRAPGRLQTKKTGLSSAKSRGFPRSCQTPPQKLQYLVGGLEHFLMFPYIGNNHPNWLIFFRRVETTNQIWLSGGRNHISIYILYI